MEYSELVAILRFSAAFDSRKIREKNLSYRRENPLRRAPSFFFLGIKANTSSKVFFFSDFIGISHSDSILRFNSIKLRNIIDS